MIEQILLKKMVDTAFSVGNRILSPSKAKLKMSTDHLEKSLQQHLQVITGWASEIALSDLRLAKSTNEVYIPLDFYLYPRRQRLDSFETPPRICLDQLIAPNEGHILILGHPGAGKTTSVKHLCHSMMHGESENLSHFSFPILIRLRELSTRHLGFDSDLVQKNQRKLLIAKIQQILGVTVIWPDTLASEEKSEERAATLERLILELLESFSPVLILEGFDEIGYRTRQEAVLEEIRFLSMNLKETLLILTSRTGDFPYRVERLEPYELCPLNSNQVKEFAQKWLGDARRAADLVQQIESSPYADTTMRPLTIAHLSAIYDRAGRIPAKPKTVYRKVVNLLLEEWDQQRSVVRISSYSNFDVDRKLEFLAHLAFHLTTTKRRTEFDKRALTSAYEALHQNFDLPANEADTVVEELESHTGLFVQAGYDFMSLHISHCRSS